MIRRKRIWITGASSGIGKALAVKLAAANNKIAISGRSLDSLESVARECQLAGAGSTVLPLVCDVTDDSITTATTLQLQQMLGGLDIVIVCAGHCEYVDNAECASDMFRRVYNVNVFGAVNTLAAALPLLKSTRSAAAGSFAAGGDAVSDNTVSGNTVSDNTVAAKPGSRAQIVAVASLSAVVGLPRAEAYGSSKAAMNYLFDSLRLDLHSEKIDVTVVNPGFVETPMTSNNDFPMPFLMQPEQAADCMIKGIAARKRHVRFPLRLWIILKLASVMPWLWYPVIGPKLARKQSGSGKQS